MRYDDETTNPSTVYRVPRPTGLATHDHTPADDITSGEAPSGLAASDQARADDSSPGDTAPGDTAPGDTAPGDTAPRDRASRDRAPGDGLPGEWASGEMAPGDRASGDRASGETASGDTASGDTVSGEAPASGTAATGEAPVPLQGDGALPDTGAAEGRAGGDIMRGPGDAEAPAGAPGEGADLMGPRGTSDVLSARGNGSAADRSGSPEPTASGYPDSPEPTASGYADPAEPTASSYRGSPEPTASGYQGSPESTGFGRAGGVRGTRPDATVPEDDAADDLAGPRPVDDLADPVDPAADTDPVAPDYRDPTGHRDPAEYRDAAERQETDEFPAAEDDGTTGVGATMADMTPAAATASAAHGNGAAPVGTQSAGAGTDNGSWLGDTVDGLRERWQQLQLHFIDDPRRAADEARAVVADTVDALTLAIASQREELDRWQPANTGDDTEELRTVVRRYRDFLDRMLAL